MDRLKEAYYRRTRGSAQTALIMRVEASMERLSVTESFSQWLWSLPSELWEEAVAWRAACDDLVRQREHAVRLITRKNRLQHTSPDSPEAHAAEDELERFRVSLIVLENVVREGHRRFVEHGREPPA